MQAISHRQQLWRHLPVFLQGFLQGNGNDLLTTQGGQAAELSAMDHINRAHAVACCQHAVEGRWSASTLDMAKDHRARLQPRALLDLLGQKVPNAAQANVPELVFCRAQINRSARNFGALGDYYDAK